MMTVWMNYNAEKFDMLCNLWTVIFCSCYTASSWWTIEVKTCRGCEMLQCLNISHTEQSHKLQPYPKYEKTQHNQLLSASSSRRKQSCHVAVSPETMWLYQYSCHVAVSPDTMWLYQHSCQVAVSPDTMWLYQQSCHVAVSPDTMWLYQLCCHVAVSPETMWLYRVGQLAVLQF